MPRQIDYGQAPEQLRTLIDELSQTGDRLDLAIQGTGFFKVQRPDGTNAWTRDYLIVNGDDHQPVALLSPLPDATTTRRMAAAKRLNAFLDSLPPSPLSEEEAIALALEATASTKPAP